MVANGRLPSARHTHAARSPRGAGESFVGANAEVARPRRGPCVTAGIGARTQSMGTWSRRAVTKACRRRRVTGSPPVHRAAGAVSRGRPAMKRAMSA